MAERPDHTSLKCSLAILRRLASGGAGRETLADFVSTVCESGRYGSLETKAELKKFENDLTRLRDLGVEYEYRDGEYFLLSYGDFDPVALSEADLNSLAFLSETFTPDSINGAAVQSLLRRIADWLPESQRGSLSGRRERWRIDLGRRDDDVIPPDAQEKIEQAIAQHRLLRFAYLSPGYRDGIPRVHTVQPWYLTFDTVRRHLYLEAYLLEVNGPDGILRETYWVHYRLGRISATEITVLPNKFAPIAPKRRRSHLEYLLAPEIAGRGEVSRHFDDMQVHGPGPDGWVRVTATTTDLFAAVQQLLRYGHNCKVLGGPEARQRMEAIVAAMAQNYGIGRAE